MNATTQFRISIFPRPVLISTNVRILTERNSRQETT